MYSKFATLTILISFAVTCSADETPRAAIGLFVKKYCVNCHGPDEQSGERRFDALAVEITDSNSLAEFQDILDQLNLGEMPPADELQPSAHERRQAVTWLTERIAGFHAARNTHGETILRRLNSREYTNTIRDLFRVNTTMFDPSVSFPRDQTTEHLDNIGGTLVTSGYLLQNYLTAAETIVHKAVFPLERPTTQKWVFKDNFKQQPEIDQVHRTTNKFDRITLFDVIGADKHEGAYGLIHEFQKGVPVDGYYEIRFRAAAVNREHPYDLDFVGTDPLEPLRLGIRPGDWTVGPLHKPQPMEPLLAEIELADEPKWYAVKVWLDAGYTPRFTFINGLMDARNMWGKLVKRYKDQFPKLKRGGIVEHRFNAIKYGKLPQIHIHEVEIKGPLIEQWPTASQVAVLGRDAEEILLSQGMTDAQIKGRLQRFCMRAYRRTATSDEVERLMKFVKQRQEGGRSSLGAFCDGVKAVLCSPAFVYLEEADERGQMSPSSVASRLSYFLWSSMPDEQLVKRLVWKNGKTKPASTSSSPRTVNVADLSAEVDRMLTDPKSDAFVNGFLEAWLTLRDFGSQPPDRDEYSKYYHYDLGAAMQEETRLFTRHLLDENLSVLNFLDSDFTFVNRRLAQHYEMNPPADSGFHKVGIQSKRRGGLLGQGSILTVTANGIDTSPVVRGVWLLENILGTPPSPPPPDIEPLDPDIRGAKTIREQLELHRTVASCNDCHKRIDPMGFALENFDPIGQWRTSYGGNRRIDPSGKLPGGKNYEDIVSFKQVLLSQEQLFVRALTSRLLSYAIGRPIEAEDRLEIDRIANQLCDQGYGFADLIKLIVCSPAFQES